MNTIFELHPGDDFACLTYLGYWPMPLICANPVHLNDGYWLSKTLPFPLDKRCQEQLGEHTTRKLKSANLVLMAKTARIDDAGSPTDPNATPRRVTYLQYGLGVWAGVQRYDEAILITGVHGGDYTSMVEGARQHLFHGSFKMLLHPASPLTEGDTVIDMERLQSSAKFAGRLERITSDHTADATRFWRVVSGVAAFLSACRSYTYEVRIHQYVRAIESFLPKSVFGHKKFAEKAGLLCCPDQNTTDALDQMYKLRSKAEHHEHFEEAGICDNKVARLRALQAEALCVELYKRLFTKSDFFFSLYQNNQTIDDFWSDDSKVKKEWGSAFQLPKEEKVDK